MVRRSKRSRTAFTSRRRNLTPRRESATAQHSSIAMKSPRNRTSSITPLPTVSRLQDSRRPAGACSHGKGRDAPKFQSQLRYFPSARLLIRQLIFVKVPADEAFPGEFRQQPCLESVHVHVLRQHFPDVPDAAADGFCGLGAEFFRIDIEGARNHGVIAVKKQRAVMQDPAFVQTLGRSGDLFSVDRDIIRPEGTATTPMEPRAAHTGW